MNEEELKYERTLLTKLNDCRYYLQILAQKKLLGDKYENGNWLEKELGELEKKYLSIKIKKALDVIETKEDKN